MSQGIAAENEGAVPHAGTNYWNAEKGIKSWLTTIRAASDILREAHGGEGVSGLAGDGAVQGSPKGVDHPPLVTPGALGVKGVYGGPRNRGG